MNGEMRPEELSTDLREGSSGFLQHRRAAVYQTGILKRQPLALRRFAGEQYGS